MSQTLKTVLSSISVSDIPTPRGAVVVVKADSTFEDAFTQLVKNNVLSAPVYDESAKKYIGMLDMRDLVSILLAVIAEQNYQGVNTIDGLLDIAKTHFKHQIEGITVSYMSRRNPFVSLPPTASLFDVLAELAKARGGRLRRVVILDPDHPTEPRNLISQSSLVKFISKHLSVLGAAGQKTVADLNLGSYPAVTVHESTQAKDVFQLLDKKQMSGVGITADDGKIVGNISGQDLKQFITKPDLKRLNLPIHDFLNQVRADQVDIRAPVITVFKTSTIDHVVGKFAATGVHRLYVVDGDPSFKPVGVISLTDVVKHLITFQ